MILTASGIICDIKNRVQHFKKEKGVYGGIGDEIA